MVYFDKKKYIKNGILNIFNWIPEFDILMDPDFLDYKKKSDSNNGKIRELKFIKCARQFIMKYELY